MNKINFTFLKLVIILIIPFQLVYLYGKDTNDRAGVVAGIVSVMATVGDRNLNIYGYASPQALITLEGMGILDHTYADNKGYFTLLSRFSSLSSREACLSSKDQLGRISSPVCLPPFPADSDAIVGPVIMPPTISLNEKDFFLEDQVVLSGQTIPNSEINLAIFNENGNNIQSPNFSFIKPVEAFTFPKIESISDDKGNFSISIPSSRPEKYRLFAQVNHEKSISPNSVKLNLEILPIWMIILKFFFFILSLIRSRILEITIILEVLYILRGLTDHFQGKAIILYQNHLPVIEQKNLPTIEVEKPLIKY
jgi:hypothetical protein